MGIATVFRDKNQVLLRGMVACRYEIISLIKLCTSLYDIANLESTFKNMLEIISAT